MKRFCLHPLECNLDDVALYDALLLVDLPLNDLAEVRRVENICLHIFLFHLIYKLCFSANALKYLTSSRLHSLHIGDFLEGLE